MQLFAKGCLLEFKEFNVVAFSKFNRCFSCSQEEDMIPHCIYTSVFLFGFSFSSYYVIFSYVIQDVFCHKKKVKLTVQTSLELDEPRVILILIL